MIKCTTSTEVRVYYTIENKKHRLQPVFNARWSQLHVRYSRSGAFAHNDMYIIPQNKKATILGGIVWSDIRTWLLPLSIPHTGTFARVYVGTSRHVSSSAYFYYTIVGVDRKWG